MDFSIYWDAMIIFLTPYFSTIYDTVQKEFHAFSCSKFAINLFQLYVSVYDNVKTNGEYLYNNYPIVTKCTDKLVYQYNSLHSKLIGYEIEPFSKFWTSTRFLMINNINQLSYDSFLYMDKYNILQMGPHISKTAIEKNGEFFSKLLDSMVNSSVQIQEGNFVMKLDNAYISRSYFNQYDSIKSDIVYPCVECPNFFLSLEYSHPKVDNIISFELTGYYYQGNIVLSPLFLKHLLALQPLHYIIDDQYIVRIVDNNVETKDITYNHSVLFHKDSYEVIEWNTINNKKTE